MALHRRGGPIVRTRKRESVWFGLDLDGVTVPANSTVVLLSLIASELLQRPFTIVRTRLLVMWQSDQIAASETPLGALGGIVTSDQALTATTIPSPVNNPDGNFFMWEPLICPFVFGSAAAFNQPGGYLTTVDSKAMRKVGLNEDVRIIAENSQATEGAIISISGRMLVKLH